MRLIKLALAAISLLILAANNACATTPVAEQAKTSSVRIIVTKNFGQELVLDQKVEVGFNSNAMEALKQVAQVEASYGGGFVNSINGIHSKYNGTGSTQQDWFFYINGLQSNTGALDYSLYPDEVEQWDFHSWSFQQSIPAIIGDFPEPFIHGHGGKTRSTIIAYTGDYRESADNLKQRLVSVGVSVVISKNIVELSEDEKESTNLFLLGIPDNQLITELNRNWKRLGFFAYFDNNNLVTLNANGQVQTRYGPSTGLIQATQNIWNPDGVGASENVVWLVSGTDIEGVKAAVDKLVNHSDELKYTFAAVVSDGEIVDLPQ